MKANELRIGNLIQSRDNREFEVTLEDLQLIEAGYLCKPIPLTEEWLLKFGFDLHSKEMYFIQGMQIWKCNETFICNKNGIIIKSVHQLQNLYFALTNEELTIKQ